MKESARAAQHEIAHNRCIAALRELPGAQPEKIQALEDVKARRMSPAVAAMEEQKIMADILEDLVEESKRADPSAVSITLDFLTSEQRQSLVSAGYHSDEDIANAPMGDLVALDHIGEATVEKIVEALGPAEDDLISVDGIGEETAAELRERGIETLNDLKAASDEDLLAVPGIGQGTLRKIRKDLA